MIFCLCSVLQPDTITIGSNGIGLLGKALNNLEIKSGSAPIAPILVIIGFGYLLIREALLQHLVFIAIK